jgi:hypothetical protein
MRRHASLQQLLRGLQVGGTSIALRLQVCLQQVLQRQLLLRLLLLMVLLLRLLLLMVLLLRLLLQLLQAQSCSRLRLQHCCRCYCILLIEEPVGRCCSRCSSGLLLGSLMLLLLHLCRRRSHRLQAQAWVAQAAHAALTQACVARVQTSTSCCCCRSCLICCTNQERVTPQETAQATLLMQPIPAHEIQP